MQLVGCLALGFRVQGSGPGKGNCRECHGSPPPGAHECAGAGGRLAYPPRDPPGPPPHSRTPGPACPAPAGALPEWRPVNTSRQGSNMSETPYRTRVGRRRDVQMEQGKAWPGVCLACGSRRQARECEHLACGRWEACSVAACCIPRSQPDEGPCLACTMTQVDSHRTLHLAHLEASDARRQCGLACQLCEC